MRITPGHPDYENYIVYLNGWIQKAAVAADDEEGWVEVVDIKAMAQIDLEELEAEAAKAPEDRAKPDLIDAAPAAAVLTKRLYGVVELVRVPD